MKTCAVLFSGGLDSVALSILLKREGMDLIPVYMSHRHGGNVTKKELETAGQLAKEITGRDLVIVKKPPLRRGDDAWYSEWGDVYYSKRLPISKKKKGRRNRIFLEIAKQLGLGKCDFVALGTLGVQGETEFVGEDRLRLLSRQRIADVSHEVLERLLEPGQLITLEALGATGKVSMLQAVGRGQKNRDLCYRSESCLMYFNTACGDCASCKSRVQAFMAAWGADKTRYRANTFAARCKRGKVTK